LSSLLTLEKRHRRALQLVARDLKASIGRRAGVRSTKFSRVQYVDYNVKVHLLVDLHFFCDNMRQLLTITSRLISRPVA
jgi:hypothetical protein